MRITIKTKEQELIFSNESILAQSDEIGSGRIRYDKNGQPNSYTDGVTLKAKARETLLKAIEELLR